MTDYLDLLAQEKIDVYWWKTAHPACKGEFEVTLVLLRKGQPALKKRVEVDTAEARAAALRELLSVIAEEKT